MTEVTVFVEAPPERVFAVLADGWAYANWVVGAAGIRHVDPGWPAVGTRIHHTMATWPVRMPDVTVVRAVREPELLELEAFLWPLGGATVRMHLDAREGGTLVRMVEYASDGVVRVVPRPVQAIVLGPRNAASLRRLRTLVLRS